MVKAKNSWEISTEERLQKLVFEKRNTQLLLLICVLMLEYANSLLKGKCIEMITPVKVLYSIAGEWLDAGRQVGMAQEKEPPVWTPSWWVFPGALWKPTGLRFYKGQRNSAWLSFVNYTFYPTKYPVGNHTDFYAINIFEKNFRNHELSKLSYMFKTTYLPTESFPQDFLLYSFIKNKHCHSKYNKNVFCMKHLFLKLWSTYS